MSIGLDLQNKQAGIPDCLTLAMFLISPSSSITFTCGSVEFETSRRHVIQGWIDIFRNQIYVKVSGQCEWNFTICIHVYICVHVVSLVTNNRIQVVLQPCKLSTGKAHKTPESPLLKENVGKPSNERKPGTILKRECSRNIESKHEVAQWRVIVLVLLTVCH